MSWQSLAQNDQKSQFRAKFGPFWEKIPIFNGKSQIFGTHITVRHLVGPYGPKMPIYGQKSQIWARFGRLWAKNPNFFLD